MTIISKGVSKKYCKFQFHVIVIVFVGVFNKFFIFPLAPPNQEPLNGNATTGEQINERTRDLQSQLLQQQQELERERQRFEEEKQQFEEEKQRFEEEKQQQQQRHEEEKQQQQEQIEELQRKLKFLRKIGPKKAQCQRW